MYYVCILSRNRPFERKLNFAVISLIFPLNENRWHNIKIPKIITEKKEDTKTITYNLYISGKSIAEIANLRGLTQPTIEKHLIDCYKDGMKLDIEKDIHTKYEKEICNMVHFMKGARLRDIKANLPYEVTYFDINYYIAKEAKNA